MLMIKHFKMKYINNICGYVMRIFVKKVMSHFHVWEFYDKNMSSIMMAIPSGRYISRFV